MSLKAFNYASLVLAPIALVAILKFGLFVPVLAACASYSLVCWLPTLPGIRSTGKYKGIIANAVVALVPLTLLVIAGAYASHYIQKASTDFVGLMQHIAEVANTWKQTLPPSLAEQLPNEASFTPWLVGMVKAQGGHLAQFGESWLASFVMAVVGVIVGVLTSHDLAPTKGLGKSIQDRAIRFLTVFQGIVGAQVWISAINTLLTSVFLLVALPLSGHALPYSASLILLTFCAGMLPIVGNLLCNSVLTIVALGVGPGVAVASLVFLVAVHKLEYFINAKIVGSRMKMAPWELLTAMFVFEALFGVVGIVAAPLYLAYLKAELKELGWI